MYITSLFNTASLPTDVHKTRFLFNNCAINVACPSPLDAYADLNTSPAQYRSPSFLFT